MLFPMRAETRDMEEVQVTLRTNAPEDVLVYFPTDALAVSLPVTELGKNLVRLEVSRSRRKLRTSAT